MTAPFLDTFAARQIERAIHRAMDWEYPSLITGDPGTGKTTALRHFAERFDGVYCEVDETAKAAGGMYKMLLRAIVGSRHGKTMWDDAAQLDGALHYEWRRSRRPLLIDEQQTFEASALRELLRVCERNRVPLVLAGNKERLAKTKKSDAGALEQIRSRIGYRVHIGAPCADDCRSFGVEYNVEGADSYAAIVAFGGNTNLRDLVRLLRDAREATGGVGSIRMRHLEAAVLGIFGDRDALKLLTPSNN